MRQVIVAGNWKLNKTVHEALDTVTRLKREISQVTYCKVIVCPPFTALAEVDDVITDSNVRLGAQDMYWEDAGAFTGEVSGPMLKDVGCSYVIIGHSERRQFFGETNETVNKKVKAALRCGLIPIICCGELLKEREADQTNQVLKSHIEGAFKDVAEKDAEKCVVAYEPVWAIGTGKVATPAQAQDAHKFIRGLLSSLYSAKLAESVSILYGGSVKPENFGDILHGPDVDGALVGGASLEAASFSALVKIAAQVRV